MAAAIRLEDKPTGSNISVVVQDADRIILVPAPKRGPAQVLAAAFLVFWLAMWAFGWISAFSQLASGRANVFLVGWLGAWSVAGICAVFTLWRILGPSTPESLTLKPNMMAYDSGVQPLRLGFGPNARSEYWNALVQRRFRIDISRQQLTSLSLRPTNSGNRLTVDTGIKRIDLAARASEVEREWLYRLLAARYGLT